MVKENSPQRVVCGIDVVEYLSFERLLKECEDELIQRFYTEREQVYCAGRISCLAARFAAKEAASKALGTGFRGVRPVEIEVVNQNTGKPVLHLHGQAAAIAEQHQFCEWDISLSHAEHYAVAFVVALRRGAEINIEAASTVISAQANSVRQSGPLSALQSLGDECKQSGCWNRGYYEQS